MTRAPALRRARQGLVRRPGRPRPLARRSRGSGPRADRRERRRQVHADEHDRRHHRRRRRADALARRALCARVRRRCDGARASPSSTRSSTSSPTSRWPRTSSSTASRAAGFGAPHRPPRHARERAGAAGPARPRHPARDGRRRLSPGERQLVEIARALHRDGRAHHLRRAHDLAHPARDRAPLRRDRGLRAEGKTVIYISHILGDVLRLADRVAVLRDGRLVGEGRGEFDIPRMIRTMIGRDSRGRLPGPQRPPAPEPVLRGRAASQPPGVIEDVDPHRPRRRIRGLFGLMGSGRSELARILMGLDPLDPRRGAPPRRAPHRRPARADRARGSPS